MISLKIFFLDVETTFRQTVPSRNLQCSPRGDAKVLAGECSGSMAAEGWGEKEICTKGAVFGQ